MPARPIWKGQIRLSLVSIPVELYSATKTSEKIAFRQIHEPSGKPIHYQKVVAGIGPVDVDEIVKGFEYEKGHYVLLDEEDLDKVKLETKKTFDLVAVRRRLRDRAALFRQALRGRAPTDELAEDAYRVVRDALKETQTVGLGQLSMRGKEYLAALKPCGKGMTLETLHYADEIRKVDSFFKDIKAAKADEELIAVAEELIERKTAPFDAAAFKNHYTAALRELINERRKGKAPKVETEEEARPRGDNVIDLMAALKRSLDRQGAIEEREAAGPNSRSRSPERMPRTSAKSRARKAPSRKARKSA